MYTDIDEPVKVEIFFAGSRVIPRWFIWNGKKIEVREVTQSWEEGDGGGKTYHFAVYDGQSVFSLSFNPQKLRWTLAGISDET
jgi:hypothetical protein